MLTLLMLISCVPKGKYVELENQLSAEKQAHAATQQETSERIDELEAKNMDLAEALASAEKDLADIEQEKASLLERNATLLEELKGKSRLKQTVQDMQKAMQELDRRKAAAEKRVAAYKDMLSRFQQLIDAGTLKVKIADGRMVVELATDILFGSGSAKLSEAGLQAVTEVATVLQSIPDKRYQVEGHTDNVPIKTNQFPSNWELASARALTVVRAMLEAGLEPQRVSAASFGEYQPVSSNAEDEGKAQNRRIEIVVLPDLEGLPGFEELQSLAE